MGLQKIILGLYVIALTFMAASCVSDKIWLQQTSHVEVEQEQVSLPHASPLLPRKLGHHEDAKVKTVGNKQYSMPFKTKGQALPGKLHEQDEERTVDPSEFLSMDYPPVRKRRPINNKLLPAAEAP